ncbi:MAG TPA: PEP-CTERM sorting domain-containing protein [Methyloversatilis sp.]
MCDLQHSSFFVFLGAHAMKHSKPLVPVAALLLSLFMSPAWSVTTTAITDTVTVGGAEWAQVNLFHDVSWDEVQAVCPGGVCASGSSLGGWDLTGWTWASASAVGDLFHVLTDGAHPGGVVAVKEAGSAWASLWKTSYHFNPTYSDPDVTYIWGLSSSLTANSEAVLPYILDAALASEEDVARTELTSFKDDKAPGLGVWLFRPVAAVPEPSVYAMLLLGLGVIGWAARRRT